MLGETISHYRVISEIGAGGMGVVYKAEDLRLGRFVALKFLPAELMRDPSAKQRFIQEARAASSLEHANICTIHDIEETTDGRMFLSMAFCEGETLKRRLERGPLPQAEALRVALQVARGLARAHEHGIVHRDVKPGNIMVMPDGEAKLLDFGIAKLGGGGDLTQTGTTLGTVAYMSPEQVRGDDVDQRSDVWSLGVVLYETLTGRRPFTGANDYALLQGILTAEPPPLEGAPTNVSEDVARVAARALAKDRRNRYPNAGEMAAALESCVTSAVTAQSTAAATPVARGRPRLWFTIPLVAVLIIGVVGGAAWWRRANRARWARATALPEILRLAQSDQYGEAFLLAKQAETVIPGDPVLSDVWPRISTRVSITTNPAGAVVSFRPVGSTGAWYSFGATPLKNETVPRGVFWWRFEKDGYEPLEVLRSTAFAPFFPGLAVTLSRRGSLPSDMVAVDIPAIGVGLTLTGFDYNKRVPVADFLIDRYEVTNTQFKAFVDVGGYEKREYWTEPFTSNGHLIDWTSAMTMFRDRTGRPGPATWQAGTYPAGQEEFPVAGVSWYEAAAYARFRGKSLPTIYHWTHAARPELGGFMTRLSNFGRNGPARVGTYHALGPYATYDMAGNVKEWIWNELAGTGNRYLLGGAWNDPDYQFLYSDARPPLDRSETNGFRCIQYLKGSGPSEPLAAPIAPPARDYAHEKPVADTVFRIYTEQYNYDRTPLDPRVGSSDDSSGLWRRELVQIGAAYGSERLPIHLFLPKNVKPPYQTILFFPGSGAIRSSTSADLQLNVIDFVIMSGRAVAYPIYKYTYERSASSVTSSWPEPTRAYSTWVQQVATDARRTLDYLETRPDIDGAKFGYYGFSWGARMSPIVLGLDARLKLGILLSGGLGNGRPAPEADPFNFAPRVRVPVLMLNGDQDFIFPFQTSQIPLFQGLGTPADRKRHVLYPGGHEIIATQRGQIVQEVVAWLDRWLGRIQ